MATIMATSGSSRAVEAAGGAVVDEMFAGAFVTAFHRVSCRGRIQVHVHGHQSGKKSGEAARTGAVIPASDCQKS